MSQVCPFITAKEEEEFLKKFNHSDVKLIGKKQMEIYGTINNLDPIFVFDKEEENNETERTDETRTAGKLSFTNNYLNYIIF